MKQLTLFMVARQDTRFQRETRRRGGPYEVQGRSWKDRKRSREQQRAMNAMHDSIGEVGWLGQNVVKRMP